MRKCSNCNEVYSDSDKFCPKCGMLTEEVNAQPQTENGKYTVRMPAKKNSRKKLVTGLVLAAVAVLLIGGLIAFLKLFNSPRARFARAQNKFIFGEAKADASIERLLRADYNAQELAVSTDSELSVKVEGTDQLDFLDNIALKLQMDVNEKTQLVGAELYYKGSSLLSGVLNMSGDGIGVYLPELSEKYYMIDPEAEGISVFGTSAADDNAASLEFKQVKNLEKEYKSIKKRYTAILAKYIKNEDFEMTSGTRTLENLDIKLRGCKEITFTPDEERLAELIKHLGSEIKKDKALSNYILSLGSHYVNGSIYEPILSSIASEFEYSDMPTDNGLIPVFEELGKELEENAEDIARSIVKSKFRWNCIIKGGEIVYQKLTFEEYGEEVVLELEKKDEKLYLCASEDGREMFSVVSDIEHKKGVYNGSVKVEENSNTVAELVINDMDDSKKSALGIPYGEFELKFKESEYSDNMIELNVNVSSSDEGGSDHIISVDLESFFDYEEDAPEKITVKLHTTDKASTVKAPDVEVTRVKTEDEFEAMGEELTEDIESIFSRILFDIAF